MTEHAAVIFVFFFLAEYASIVLICILTSILFLGGYLYNCIPSFIFELFQYISYEYYSDNAYYTDYKYNESLFLNPIVEGLMYGLALGIKSCIMIFIFI
jgi:NADH-ubiquinone oxidoreductase chain 1